MDAEERLNKFADVIAEDVIKAINCTVPDGIRGILLTKIVLSLMKEGHNNIPSFKKIGDSMVKNWIDITKANTNE